MGKFHSLFISRGEHLEPPPGAYLLIDRELKSDKLDRVTISDKQLLQLISKAATYLDSKIQ